MYVTLKYPWHFYVTIICILLVHLDSHDEINRYALLQYFFDGPKKDVMVKPHGNSKTAKLFFTPSIKTKKCIASLAAKSTPKEVVHKITIEEGGEIHAR